MSPKSFLGDAEYEARRERRARSHGQLPLQQSVSSASHIPPSPSKKSFSSHIASYQYVQQHRIFLERQRELHDEERKLWHLERQELHTRISNLETTVRQLQQKSTSQHSPPDRFFNSTPMIFGSDSSNNSSRTTNGSTGDEFWRGAGGQRDSIPTRTFSDATDYSTNKAEDRHLPSIAENEVAAPVVSSSAGISRAVSNESNGRRRRSSIDGAQIDKNLDGISFKPNAPAPFIFHKTKSSQPLSPPSPLVFNKITLSQSPSPPSPNSGPASPQKSLEIPSPINVCIDDPHIRHAGHTPLARGGSVYSDRSSSEVTPKLPDSADGHPEPRPSVAVSRPPKERSESYFPPPPETIDEDPELKGPLSLQNGKPDDKSFLQELDSKLLQAARSHAVRPSVPSEPESLDKAHDEADHEPKLRIKRSMNFGSAFGATSCGKGF